MSKSIFITGIDTDIGKTFVAGKILETFKKDNKKVAYYKPVQSGGFCDTDYIKKLGVKVFNSYTFKTPVSPHYASELEKIEINKEKLILDYEKIKKEYSHTIVEGAGGVIVPLIRDEYYIYDLIEDIDIPVLLVTELSVGSINKTLLTYEFLKSRGIEIISIFANRYKNEKHQIDNKKAIENYTEVEILTEFRGVDVERLFK